MALGPVEMALNHWNEPSVRKSRPRRISEIWKLDRESHTVIAMGFEGLMQLNALGSAIWLKLDGNHTLENIIEELMNAYPNQDKPQLEADIFSFIQCLIANHLIVQDWHSLWDY